MPLFERKTNLAEMGQSVRWWTREMYGATRCFDGCVIGCSGGSIDDSGDSGDRGGGFEATVVERKSSLWCGDSRYCR